MFTYQFLLSQEELSAQQRPAIILVNRYFIRKDQNKTLSILQYLTKEFQPLGNFIKCYQNKSNNWEALIHYNNQLIIMNLEMGVHLIKLLQKFPKKLELVQIIREEDQITGLIQYFSKLTTGQNIEKNQFIIEYSRNIECNTIIKVPQKNNQQQQQELGFCPFNFVQLFKFKNDFLIVSKTHQVDKSLFIKDIIDYSGNVMFLRPRKWGKKRLAKMLESFLNIRSKEKKIIKNSFLSSHKIYQIVESSHYQYRHTYPFLYIQIPYLTEKLKQSYTALDLRNIIVSAIQNALCSYHSIEFKSGGAFQIPVFDGSNFKKLEEFLRAIKRIFSNKIYIVIVDFDQFLLFAVRILSKAPFDSDAYHLQLELNHYMKEVIAFFINLKEIVEKVLLFGNQNSLYDSREEFDQNNMLLCDITEPKFSQYFGLTRKEVKYQLLKHIVNDIQMARLLLDKLEHYCGGYWTESSKVYHPFILESILSEQKNTFNEEYPPSIMNFMIQNQKILRENSSVNSIIQKLVNNEAVQISYNKYRNFLEQIIKDGKFVSTEDCLNVWLINTGFLTLKEGKLFKIPNELCLKYLMQ